MTYKVQSGGFSGFLRRNSNTISLTIILLSITAIFLMQAMTIAQLQKDVEGQTAVIKGLTELATQIDENAKERSRQIDGIDRHLDCIVYFFSQKDRSQKAIDDIDECRITVNESRFYNSQPPQSKTQTQSAPPSTTESNSTPLEDTPPFPEPQPGFIKRTLNNLLGGL